MANERSAQLCGASVGWALLAFVRGFATSARAAVALGPCGGKRDSSFTGEAMGGKQHWENVYRTKDVDRVSWYRPHLERSLSYIRAAGLGPDARIVDVGGGASTLVDDLLAEGYRNVAVIDLAEPALDAARGRLGERAAEVDWVAGDATDPLLPAQSVDFWHDRAVFHFLGEGQARAAYVDQVRRCLKPGGYLLVATFALDGPQKCSGLPVTRYDAQGLRAAFGEGFRMLDETSELHETPSAVPQSFVYVLWQRVDPKG